MALGHRQQESPTQFLAKISRPGSIQPRLRRPCPGTKYVSALILSSAFGRLWRWCCWQGSSAHSQPKPPFEGVTCPAGIGIPPHKHSSADAANAGWDGQDWAALRRSRNRRPRPDFSGLCKASSRPLRSKSGLVSGPPLRCGLKRFGPAQRGPSRPPIARKWLRRR